MNTIYDFSLFKFIIVSSHHSSIVVIALDKANLQSAIIAISSAKANTYTPSTFSSYSIKSLMKILNKRGDRREPYGTPEFTLISFSYKFD